MVVFRQCECGAYRASTHKNGKWTWTFGCKACGTIERLNILLRGGVKIVDKHCGGKKELKAEIERLNEELLSARMELKRARHSARAAQAATERIREGCRYATMAGDEWN